MPSILDRIAQLLQDKLHTLDSQIVGNIIQVNLLYRKTQQAWLYRTNYTLQKNNKQSYSSSKIQNQTLVPDID